MNRRIFFRSFAGLGIPAVPGAKPKPATLWAYGTPICGQCRTALLIHADHYGVDPREFVMCTTEGCSHRGKALFLPSVEVAPADPKLVRHVLRLEDEEIKRREIERAKDEETRKQDLERPSWGAYRYEVRTRPMATIQELQEEAWSRYARDFNYWREKYSRWECEALEVTR